MKILRLISSVDPRNGGAAEAAFRVDQELGLRGHEVEVACLDRARMDFHQEYPAEVHVLGSGASVYGYSKKLEPWLRTNMGRFDACIVDGLWQFHGFAAWRVLAGSALPYFVFPHGMLDPWFKRRYPLKHLKKWLYWPWGEYRVLRDARAVIFTCEEERRLAAKSFWLYRCREVVTAFGTSTPPLSGDVLSERFLLRFPELAGKRLVLYLSRIHEKKGCDLLVDAFAKVADSDRDLHLVIAGPDQTGQMGNLRDRAKRLGIADRISWPGMLQGDDKWGAFHSAEVFCLPSHQENFGIVVAEALGCGKPVLISNKVNIWREIEADRAGIVGEDTVEGTTKALESWLTLAPDAQQEMREAARRCFDARFRIDRVGESLISILQAQVPTNANVGVGGP